MNPRNWGLKLSGRENQDIRYLIHSCRRTIVAIGECPQPLLTDILPLASEYPSILSALLALSARQRIYHYQFHLSQPHSLSLSLSPSSALSSISRWEALDWHQDTITKVRATLSRLQQQQQKQQQRTPGDSGDGAVIIISQRDIVEVLGSCLLLALFGFPEQEHNWSMHVAGMIAFIESLEEMTTTASAFTPTTTITTMEIVPLVKTARTVAAYLDIFAFALNRPQQSQRKWLRWGICPLPLIAREQQLEEDENGAVEFTPFEVSTGYPETLVTLIALVSVVVEDLDVNGGGSSGGGSGTDYGRVIDGEVACYIQDIYRVITQELQQELQLADNDDPEIYWKSRMHIILSWWETPAIPPHISATLSLASTTAWEIMRKAAHIYLSRGGFTANILYTKPTQRRQRTNRRYVREILVGLQSLVRLAEEQEITIANAMIWPMTVVGNEICDDRPLQTELVALFQRWQAYFRIAHSSHVLELLTELWRRFADASSPSTESAQATPSLSLHMLAAEKDLSIPLF
ncbi:hypothetical protein AbraIFM66951_006680 [Aspergillus brasiliensis]|uniref:Transcription factor domain-containing protein n=1 Tax=Aspergillus brasiliensis TaxID=319629 RepID=A0A9W5YR17_9EURO|nr:hypothetical protein AbraCBS73388_007393 [Aspergillus brasiliensis]GKZ44476.1 hypothetical protein AbraIFM66951_006680 [Aspergillus brasiliensis]